MAALQLQPGDIGIDCTTGAGGHTALMLGAVGESGKVFAIDRDETAIKLAAANLDAENSANLTLVHGRFSELGDVICQHDLDQKVQGICADIGVSSMHLDRSERGFSFMNDGPLDMRMDQGSGRTAADIVNEESEEELTRIFREYGEEPKAKFAARRIVEAREGSPITTTAALADLVKGAIHYPARSRKHPATKVFQALRIAVNEELGELQTMLDDAFAALRPGGRLAIISFHALEDRIVKTKFRELAGRVKEEVPRGLPIPNREEKAPGKIVKPFPQKPTDEEIERNPRARSAKLRVVEKEGQ